VLKNHIEHKNKKQEKILPLVSIDELSGSVDVTLLNNEFEDGNISSFELECICKLVKKLNPGNIFEIGTYNGRTTLHMAANTSPETAIYTLDLPKDELTKTKLRIKSGEKKFIDKSSSGSQFVGTEFENRIYQIYADSAKYNFATLNNTMDFVFIDGSHSYEYVIHDTYVAINLLRNGKGVILWHDYGWSEVILALNELYKNDIRFRNLKNITGTSFGYIEFI
jgi:predicted O-methyltransferase YrrM